MNQLKAIGAFCRECLGGDSKAVTVCTGFYCPLWPFRLGLSMRSKHYAARIKRLFNHDCWQIKEVKSLGFSEANFLKKPSKELRNFETLMDKHGHGAAEGKENG